jgi:hypothetical protein
MPIYTHKSADLRKMGFNYVSLAPQVIQAIKNPEALAIWTYLQSHAEHWKVRRSQIMAHFGLGRIRYDKAIKELRRLRLYWVENIQNTEHNTHFTDREIWVSSLPREKMQDIDAILQMPLEFSGSLQEWREQEAKSAENRGNSARSDFRQVQDHAQCRNQTTAAIRPLNESLSKDNKRVYKIINEDKREREPQAPPVNHRTTPQQHKNKKRVDNGVKISLDWSPSLGDIMRICERAMIDMNFMVDVVVPSFQAGKAGQTIHDVESELQRWAVREKQFHSKKQG